LCARQDQKGLNMARQTTGKKSRAAEEGRHVQDAVDQLEQKAKSSPPRRPMQTGQREYPSEFPAQHLKKSGAEAELELAPMYQAPGYEGSHKLQDMVALITGGDSGIGRAVAVLFAREGADVVICYLEESDDARDFYVHPEILQCYLDGELVQTLRKRIERELAQRLGELAPAEAATLALLHRRLNGGAKKSRRARPAFRTSQASPSASS
jgi:short chain dehydrogenase